MQFVHTYLDIIIFAVIAIVLLFRLRSVFGQRSDQDPPSVDLRNFTRFGSQVEKKNEKKKGLKDIVGTASFPEDKGNVASLNDGPQQPINPMDRWTQNLPNFSLVSNATTHHVLTQFPAFDPSFRPDDFLEKARKAFVLVVQAYSEGNKNSLDFLLSEKLKNIFYASIDAREAAKEYNHIQFHGIVSAIISDADLNGSVARVTVDVVSEQSITRKDVDGNFIGHYDGRRITARDRWVFMRDLKDGSPSWVLEDTLAHED